jgi:outer membrane usher protein
MSRAWLHRSRTLRCRRQHGFLNYSISQYYAHTAQGSSSSVYGFTNSGINLGLWRLRQQGSLGYDSRSGLRWNPVRTYARRACPAGPAN